MEMDYINEFRKEFLNILRNWSTVSKKVSKQRLRKALTTLKTKILKRLEERDRQELKK